MKTNDKITKTTEGANVIAFTHSDIAIKVRTSSDCPSDPNSLWSAFASSEGVAIPVFGGKSFKSQKSAEHAARKYLEQAAARIVVTPKVVSFKPSTADDVLTW
jgi:hypothetical protein